MGWFSSKQKETPGEKAVRELELRKSFIKRIRKELVEQLYHVKDNMCLSSTGRLYKYLGVSVENYKIYLHIQYAEDINSSESLLIYSSNKSMLAEETYYFSLRNHIIKARIRFLNLEKDLEIFNIIETKN